MHIAISVHGLNFDPYEFLLQIQHLPADYHIWDQEEIEMEGNGVTLIFDSSTEMTYLPFALGRFLLSNKELLKTYNHLDKELNIVVDTSTLNTVEGNRLLHFEITPKFMKLLSELDIRFIMAKTIDL